MEKINLNQITVLIRWGLCGEHDAVAHLGNLIIDGILTFDLL